MLFCVALSAKPFVCNPVENIVFWLCQRIAYDRSLNPEPERRSYRHQHVTRNRPIYLFLPFSIFLLFFVDYSNENPHTKTHAHRIHAWTDKVEKAKWTRTKTRENDREGQNQTFTYTQQIVGHIVQTYVSTMAKLISQQIAANAKISNLIKFSSLIVAFNLVCAVCSMIFFC